MAALSAALLIQWKQPDTHYIFSGEGNSFMIGNAHPFARRAEGISNSIIIFSDHTNRLPCGYRIPSTGFDGSDYRRVSGSMIRQELPDRSKN